MLLDVRQSAHYLRITSILDDFTLHDLRTVPVQDVVCPFRSSLNPTPSYISEVAHVSCRSRGLVVTNSTLQHRFAVSLQYYGLKCFKIRPWKNPHSD